MTDGGLTILDGTRLRTLELCLPDTKGAIKGAQLLSIAEAEASSSYFGLSLPEALKSNALKRLNIDSVAFSFAEFDRDEASSKLVEYVGAIADELDDDPIVVSVLDGTPIRLFLEDEDDFAMLAENLFTDLDVADKGKIKKDEIRNALVQMGVGMGVPPFSEFPLLNDILKEHGAEGEEELGQAQFAELLQLVLQDLADALSIKHIIIIQKIKIINGSTLRKLLADEKQLNNLKEKIFHDMDASSEEGSTGIRKAFLDKNGSMLGLPSEMNEAVVLLFDQVLADVNDGKFVGELRKEEIGVHVKDILEKFAEQLEANPILHGLDI